MSRRRRLTREKKPVKVPPNAQGGLLRKRFLALLVIAFMAIALPVSYRSLLQIREEDDTIKYESEGVASWYQQGICRQEYCAASTEYPRDTYVEVEAIETGQSIVVRINDYGPDPGVHPDRIIDLDLPAFRQLANPEKGTIVVRTRPVEIGTGEEVFSD